MTPEEIERVDVLYGPFSAAYPGNSVGAVVDYVTRMPSELEARANVSTLRRRTFSIYSTEGDFSGQQVSASVGNRHGAFSWWVNANRLDSDAPADRVPEQAGAAPARPARPVRPSPVRGRGLEPAQSGRG